MMSSLVCWRRLDLLWFSFAVGLVAGACASEPRPALPIYKTVEILPARPDALEQQYFIKSYQGYLGDNVQALSIQLIHWGKEKITGKHHYSESPEFLISKGEMTDRSTFQLVEYRIGQKNAYFQGQFEDSLRTIRGTWWNIDSTFSMPFALREAVSTMDTLQWTGAWHLNDPWDTCTLFIGNVTDRHFDFAMSIHVNGYKDELYGSANIYGHRAVMDKPFDRIYEENCRMVFYRKEDGVVIKMESLPYLCNLGDICWLDGHYDDIYFGKNAYLTYGDDLDKDVFRNEEQYQRFEDLVGVEGVRKFAYSMEYMRRQTISSPQDSIQAIAYQARVLSMYRNQEVLVMYDEAGRIWAGITTPAATPREPVLVHYYANDPAWVAQLPERFQDWLEYLPRHQLIYASK